MKHKDQVEEDGKSRDDSQDPSLRCRKGRVSGKEPIQRCFGWELGGFPGVGAYWGVDLEFRRFTTEK